MTTTKTLPLEEEGVILGQMAIKKHLTGGLPALGFPFFTGFIGSKWD